MWIVRVALNRPYTFVVLALLILGIGPLTVARTPTAPSQAAVYQQLLAPSTDGQRAGRILKRSAIGAAVVIGLAGWLWRSKKSSDPGPARPPNSSV